MPYHRPPRCFFDSITFLTNHRERILLQKLFCQEAVVWKYLQHPNILPILGATITPPQLVSALMSAGDLSEYVEKNPSADKLRLVGVPLLSTL